MRLRILFLGTILSLSVFILQGQDLSQNLRGKVFDNITKEPLPGANIIIAGTGPILGTVSNINGEFRFDSLPLGRTAIKVSYIGYHQVEIGNLHLTSGKEVVLEIPMEEMVVQVGEVVITAKRSKNKPINKMATSSARSFTVEESQRYAGSRNDVARMASNFAGVRGSDDSRNDIVIRGNSPVGLLWKLEGVDIPNPNHYGALGTTGGPVSILNNNLLSNSDFLTAAFPSEYGNAIAGVFDLNMRKGNNDTYEFLGQVGFNGFELGAEGPVKRENSSSFITNFRYSTLEIFEKLGVDFGTGTAVPKYKDFAVKFDFPDTRAGNFSFFGMGGISNIAFLESKNDTSKVNLYAGEGYDLINSSDMAVAGMNHTYALSRSMYTKFILSYTYHKFKTRIDSIVPVTHHIQPQYRNNFSEEKVFASIQLISKINSRHNFKTGITATRLNFILTDSIVKSNGGGFHRITDYNGHSYLIQSFLQWQFKLSEKLLFNPGLYYQTVTFNNTNSIEPRFGLKWTPFSAHAFGFSLGLHSQLFPITVYFNQEPLPDGDYQRLNENLDMVKSHHFVISHDWVLNEYIRIKTEIYYQGIVNAAVDAHSRNSYSILNQGANFFIATPDTLKNGGEGYNYGLEITMEHFLKKGFYFLFTSALYESKYRGSDGVLRNTAFNGNYVFNFLTGKELDISHWFKKQLKKHTLIFDIKATFAGGQRYTPINVDRSLAEGRRVYYDHLAYSLQYHNYFRTDLRLALRQDSRNFAMEWAVDVQNLFNITNIYQQSFDIKTGTISDINQLGILIIPQFRIEF